MCGIVSVTSFRKGGLFSYHLDIFKQLLIVDSVRGEDGTGAFTINRNKKVSIAKIHGNPFNFLGNPQGSSFLSDSLSRGLSIVGHNRAATRGQVNSENAHPFWYKDIVLVHNGTLHNHYEFPQWKEHNLTVDSSIVPILLWDHPYEEVFERISGAFAFVFYDKRSERLNFIRNKERPLFMGYNEDEDILVLSSEKGAMEWISERNQVKLEIEEVYPGTMFSVDVFEEGLNWDVKEYKFRIPIIQVPATAVEVTTIKEEEKKSPVLEVVKEKPRLLNSPVREGNTVYFELVDTKRIGKGKVLVVGTFPWSSEYQVSAVVDAKEEDNIILARFLRGTVTKIRENKAKNSQIKYVVSIENVVVVTNCHSKNGHYLSEKDVQKVKNNGCEICKSEVKVEDIPRSVWNKAHKVIFCPQCSIAQQMDTTHSLFPRVSLKGV